MKWQEVDAMLADYYPGKFRGVGYVLYTHPNGKTSSECRVYVEGLGWSAPHSRFVPALNDLPRKTEEPQDIDDGEEAT